MAEHFLDIADFTAGAKTDVWWAGRSKAVATKLGNVRDAEGKFLGVNGGPKYVRSRCDASLQRLGVRLVPRDTLQRRWRAHVLPWGAQRDTGAQSIPAFSHLTLKGRAASPPGPWSKPPDLIPFRTRPGRYYSATTGTGARGHLMQRLDTD